MKIVFASNNLGKLRELQHLLAEAKIEVIPQTKFNVVEVEETGLTFVENALLKARNACQQSHLAAIADDSGLEVDAIDGRPGIHSSRYAGSGATDQENVNKLLQELASVPKSNRQARFHCVMVYLRHAQDPTPIICHGVWEGEILFEPRGQNGFGFDPIFWVPTHNCSAAELSLPIKNQISHRAQALRQLIAHFNTDDLALQ